jgi:hypothetical protein
MTNEFHALVSIKKNLRAPARVDAKNTALKMRGALESKVGVLI